MGELCGEQGWEGRAVTLAAREERVARRAGWSQNYSRKKATRFINVPPM